MLNLIWWSDSFTWSRLQLAIGFGVFAIPVFTLAGYPALWSWWLALIYYLINPLKSSVRRSLRVLRKVLFVLFALGTIVTTVIWVVKFWGDNSSIWTRLVLIPIPLLVASWAARAR